MFRGGLKVFVALAISINSVQAFAQAPGIDHPCAPSKELSMDERSAFIGFRSALSWLQGWHGKKAYEARLNDIIQNKWPKVSMVELSPYFFEKVLNLVDQEKLKNAIAWTVGLESKVWNDFERHMRTITIFGGTSQKTPVISKSAETLITAISKMKRPKELSHKDFDVRKAEAIARVVDMHTYMLRWRALNSEIIDERGAVAAKQLAIMGIGLIGGAVLCSTLIAASPVVAGAGAMGAGLSTNPATSLLLMKIAETAAGSAMGLVGAPAAILVQDSYRTMARAKMNSLNNQSSFSCELSKQMQEWKDRAPDRLLSSAIVGASYGAGGGLLTFTGKGAKAVLWVTSVGVGIAQAYALGKLSTESMESIAFYRLAYEAAQDEDFAQAKEFLIAARAKAVSAGDYGLEAIIVATLSVHIVGHFKQALAAGQSEIRAMYAASADTIPTAGNASVQAASAVMPVGADQVAKVACDRTKANYRECMAKMATASR